MPMNRRIATALGITMTTVMSSSVSLATPQQEMLKLVSPDPASGDEFGYAVTIDDTDVIIGARFDSDSGTDSGLSHPYEHVGANWINQTAFASTDAASGDRFGESVSLGGVYLVVGAPRNSDAGTWSGSAYVFKRDVSSWTQEAKLASGDAEAFDQFGIAVAMDGDYAIVGSLGDDDDGSQSGSAYVFFRTGTSWTQQPKITAADGAAGDKFGTSVSINGDYALVGAVGDDSSRGAAYVFKRNGTDWNEEAKLIADDGAAGDSFGTAVSIHGVYAVVGAPGDEAGMGSAYIFERSGATWSQVLRIVAADGVDRKSVG